MDNPAEIAKMTESQTGLSCLRFYFSLGEHAMKTSKPIWLGEPEEDQTSIRFCCPHCSSWVRNREFEEHLKTQHAEQHAARKLAKAGNERPAQ